ncbi:MAG: hypothetical protein HC788_10920 [Sphingopyxis sp.]|nr:hypothetical protein [Sphingopyxis sp.]
MKDKQVEYLGLQMSTRAYHCLHMEGIDTIEKLTSMYQGELLRIPNFGRKSLNEIEDALRQRGLSIRRHPSDPRSTPEGEELYQDYTLAKLKWEVYVMKFQKEDLSERLRKLS